MRITSPLSLAVQSKQAICHTSKICQVSKQLLAGNRSRQETAKTFQWKVSKSLLPNRENIALQRQECIWHSRVGVQLLFRHWHEPGKITAYHRPLQLRQSSWFRSPKCCVQQSRAILCAHGHIYSFQSQLSTAEYFVLQHESNNQILISITSLVSPKT